VGVAPAQRWRTILAGSGAHSGFVGVDESRFPRDFASFGRFNRELRELDDRQRPPTRLSFAELDDFLTERIPDGLLAWIDDEPAA
jgi:hypothetical protein